MSVALACWILILLVIALTVCFADLDCFANCLVVVLICLLSLGCCLLFTACVFCVL